MQRYAWRRSRPCPARHRRPECASRGRRPTTSLSASQVRSQETIRRRSSSALITGVLALAEVSPAVPATTRSDPPLLRRSRPRKCSPLVLRRSLLTLARSRWTTGTRTCASCSARPSWRWFRSISSTRTCLGWVPSRTVWRGCSNTGLGPLPGSSTLPIEMHTAAVMVSATLSCPRTHWANLRSSSWPVGADRNLTHWGCG